MQKRRAELTSISDVLKGTAKRLKIDKRISIHSLGSRWKSIFGPSIGMHSYPAKLVGKKLTILVDHPTWMQELSFLKPQVLAKIQEELKGTDIRDIRFELGQHPSAPPEENRFPHHSAKRKLEEEEIDFIERAAEQIDDPEIQGAARRAMTKGFINRRRP